MPRLLAKLRLLSRWLQARRPRPRLPRRLSKPRKLLPHPHPALLAKLSSIRRARRVLACHFSSLCGRRWVEVRRCIRLWPIQLKPLDRAAEISPFPLGPCLHRRLEPDLRREAQPLPVHVSLCRWNRPGRSVCLSALPVPARRQACRSRRLPRLAVRSRRPMSSLPDLPRPHPSKLRACLVRPCLRVRHRRARLARA
jgi:hypothetical protein